jgi:hypothetical protein
VARKEPVWGTTAALEERGREHTDTTETVACASEICCPVMDTGRKRSALRGASCQ